MNFRRTRWAIGVAAIMLGACTEALYVGNEPIQTTGVGGTGGATSSETTQAIGGAEAAPSATGAQTRAPSSASDCVADVSLTPTQMGRISELGCIEWAIEPESLPAKLGLVVDVSDSMAQPAPGTSATKWEVTRSLLNEIVLDANNGAGLLESDAVGLLLFPNQPNMARVPSVPVDVSLCLNTAAMVQAAALGGDNVGSQRSLLRLRLNEAVLGNGTPTHDAYDYALFNMMLSSASEMMPYDRVMLLITDGSPSFNKGCYNQSGKPEDISTAAILASVEYARGQGIRTFVIGLPGSEPARDWLSKAAYLGGTGRAGCAPEDPNGSYCHRDLSQVADLDAALRTTLRSIVPAMGNCRFELPEVSPPSAVAVDNTRMVPIVFSSAGHLLHDNTAAPFECTAGYRLPGASDIILNRDACLQVQSGESALSVHYGCTPDEITSVAP